MERSPDWMILTPSRPMQKRPRSSGAYRRIGERSVQPVMVDARDTRGPAGDVIRFDEIEEDRVEISVGSEPNVRTFVLDRAALTTSSQILQGLFLGEDSIGKAELEDEAADDFNLYLNWLHSGVVATKKTANERDEDDESDDTVQVEIKQEDPEFTQLTSLYILGKHLEDNDFINAVIDGIFGKMREAKNLGLPADDINKVPGPGCVDLIYSETAGEDKLKRLLLDLYGTKTSHGMLRQFGLERFRVEFRNELLMEVLEGGVADMDIIINEDNCDYHYHTGDERCDRARPRKRRRLV